MNINRPFTLPYLGEPKVKVRQLWAGGLAQWRLSHCSGLVAIPVQRDVERRALEQFAGYCGEIYPEETCGCYFRCLFITQHSLLFSVFFKEKICLFPLSRKNSGIANPAKNLLQTCFLLFFLLPFCSHRQDCLRSHLLSATTDPLNVLSWTFFSAPRSRVAEWERHEPGSCCWDFLQTSLQS